MRGSIAPRLLKSGMIVAASLVTLSIIGIFTWLARLDSQIAERFAGKRFAPPVEFYSSPETIRPGSLLPKNYFEAAFQRRRFRMRQFGQPLQPGDESVWTADECRSLGLMTGEMVTKMAQNAERAAADGGDSASSASGLSTFAKSQPAFAAANPLAYAMSAPLETCVAFRNIPSAAAAPQRPSEQTENRPPKNLPAEPPSEAAAVQSAERPVEEPAQIAAFDANGRVLATFVVPLASASGSGSAAPVPAPSVTLGPELFAEYYGDKPVLRKVVPLGTVPGDCINALVAIEDSTFWEHSGVSPAGLARAALVFLRTGHASQGGSTITQQLVKNYF